VVVVVLGHEYAEIQQPHRLLQPRVQRRLGEVRLPTPFQPVQDPSTRHDELLQHRVQPAFVVVGRVGLAVLQVGGGHGLHVAGEDLVDPGLPQLLQVQEVAEVLQGGPLAVGTGRDRGRRRLPQAPLRAAGGVAEALHDVGIAVQGQVEHELPFEPEPGLPHGGHLPVVGEGIPG